MFAGVSSSSRATRPNTEMRRRVRRWDSEVRPVRCSTSSFRTRSYHQIPSSSDERVHKKITIFPYFASAVVATAFRQLSASSSASRSIVRPVANPEVRVGGGRSGSLGAVHPAGVQGAESPLRVCGRSSPEAAVLIISSYHIISYHIRNL